MALVDIGRFGWYCHASIFDLGALTDAHLARQPGGHLKKRWDPAYFAQRHPEMVILLAHGDPWRPGARIKPSRTIEIEVLRSMDELGDYVLRAAVPLVHDDFYLVFSRRQVPLPARMRGAWMPGRP